MNINVGMADDLIGVRYRAKFVVQILCALMLVAGGIFIQDLHGLLWINELPIWIGIPLTILIVVIIINAMNLIDGIDGLASSLSGIAALFYGFVFFKYGYYFYAMLSYATFGVLLPFFWYNVFGNAEKQKKIFMGDTGSLTIGIILSFLSIKLLSCVPVASDHATPNPLVLAFVPLAVPCLDVIRVYFHRIRHKSNPFLPDKNHIHHKLLALGMSQWAAMLTIVSFSVFLILSNLAASLYLNINVIILLDIALWTALNLWLTNRIQSRHQR